MKVMRGISLMLLGVAMACGGSVEREEQGGGEAGQANGDAGGSKGSNGSNKVPLGECKPGFAPGTPGKECRWLSDGLCFEERDAACACACPRDKDSICQSSLIDPYPIEVFCY